MLFGIFSVAIWRMWSSMNIRGGERGGRLGTLFESFTLIFCIVLDLVHTLDCETNLILLFT